MKEEIKAKTSTTYSRAVQKGIKLGIEKGRKEGPERLIKNFMEYFPNTTDKEISSIFKISLDWVKEIRNNMTSIEPKKNPDSNSK